MATVNNTTDLDKIFEALANKHRREIIYAVSLQPHSISKLASLRNLSLPAIHKHLKVLESSNLIVSKKTGRVNYIALNKKSLLKLQEWLMQYHPHWGNDNDTFDNYADYLAGGKGLKGGENK